MGQARRICSLAAYNYGTPEAQIPLRPVLRTIGKLTLVWSRADLTGVHYQCKTALIILSAFLIGLDNI